MAALAPIFAMALLLFGMDRLEAQERDDGARASITGQVMEEGGSPVVGAQISLGGTGRGSETNERGRFLFTNVEPGSYTIRVERLGYAEAERLVTVSAGGAAEIELVLSRAAVELEGVTAIGSREELDETRERMRRIPGAVALLEPADIRSTRQANFKDVLRFTPGVYIQPRFGAADESQLSIRGSGLRNNFHLRGVNILVNGMPYRLADGFTDFESLELLTTENIQVYKGANALRFGGSTLGGAINLETKTGHTGEPLNIFAQGGSFGFGKAQLSTGQVLGDFNYYASYTRTELDGEREFSDQRRDRVNVQAGHRISDAVDLRSFYMFAWVEEELPGSLTRSQLESDPDMAHPINVADRYGRDYQLHHIGVQLRSRLGDGQRLDVSPYFQYRSIVHPIFRVLDQDSRDWGAEARYTNDNEVGGHDNQLTLGVQWAWGENDNRHFENEGGESGALAKDQLDVARNLAVYAEDVFGLTDRLSTVVGLRWSVDDRELDDFFLADGDQTDQRKFRAFQPKVGLLYSLPSLQGQVFANASRTYEPPLMLELNSFTLPGFVDIDAQDAWQVELGTRGRAGGLQWDVAAYDIELRDEIININVQPFPGAPFTVPSYRNVPESRHWGLEAGLSYELPGAVLIRQGPRDRLGARVSYTWGNFEFLEDPEYAGNEIPGVPEHIVQAELSYRHPSGLTVKPSLEWAPGEYFVDSGNTVQSDGWLTLSTRLDWLVQQWEVNFFVEGRNLTNEVYTPAVTVDDGAGRYFFPADSRSVYAGVRWQPQL